MRRISFLACLLFLQVPAGSVSAQQDIAAEGFSSPAAVSDDVARQALPSLQRRDPGATLQDAKVSVARRAARTDAIRSAAEYLHGVQFEFSQGRFTPTITTQTEGTVSMGSFTFRQLDSGMVVASMRIPLSEAQRAARRGLETYELTGIATETEGENPLMVMRTARMDAYVKAVQRAVSDSGSGALEPGATVRGTLYIVETVGDVPGEPYRLIMRLQVRLDN